MFAIGIPLSTMFIAHALFSQAVLGFVVGALLFTILLIAFLKWEMRQLSSQADAQDLLLMEQ